MIFSDLNANRAVAQAQAALAAAIVILAPLGARAAGWPATPAGRQAARAELDRFEAGLGERDSATEALRRWCAGRHLADPPVIRALRAKAMDKPASEEIRRLLKADPGEVIAYRRVRLACGTLVLSEADNWYRPGGLTVEMNQTLATTDTPFGVVVRPLGFHRRSLDVQWLYDPLAPGAQVDAGALVIAPEVLRHRAVLETGDGAPFSLVVETYAGAVLAGGPAEDITVSR